MQPLSIVRNLEKGVIEACPYNEASQIALWITENEPADTYIYSHFGSHENVIHELRLMGHEIYRYFNFLTVQIEASSYYYATYNRILRELVDKYDLTLNDKNGNPFLYFATGYADAHLIDWSKFTNELIDRLVSRFIFVRGPIEIDLAEPKLRSWMIRDAQALGIDNEVLETLYDKDLYKTNYMTFVNALITNRTGPQRRKYVLNPSASYSSFWYDKAFRIIWENATDPDRLTDAQFELALNEWQDRPGCFIEIREPKPGTSLATIQQIYRRANDVINLWSTTGGYLLINNEQPYPSSMVYWAMNVQKYA